jgi:hypothetical protein
MSKPSAIKSPLGAGNPARIFRKDRLMFISAIALLLPAPVLATPPLAAAPAAQSARAAEEQGQSAQTAGLSVQRVCKTSGPTVFSGRARKERCELAVVRPTCKSRAPSMFSGRARTTNCEVEMREPEVATYAPAIFSGRRARPASAYAAPQYSYVVAADGTATPQVTVQTVQQMQEAERAKPRRRLPSMFTGRRPKPRTAEPAQ